MMNLKVAITHDYLTQFGGAERVLWKLLRMFPDADLYTALLKPTDQPRGFWFEIKRHKTFTSRANKYPLKKLTWRLFLDSHRKFFERIDFSDYDLVISSSSGFAKFINPKKVPHIAYIHTPPRFMWGYETAFFHKIPAPIRFGLKSKISTWREMDKKYAKKATKLIANSKHIQKKIKESYGKISEVIYPPVNIEEIMEAPSEETENFYLTINRLYPYKKVDVMVEAFKDIKSKLVVIGDGPERRKLEEKAGKNVIFKGFVSEEEKVELLKKCKGFIFMTEEDFGIVIVEALAAGKSVIAFAKGGALEIIKDGKNGILFDSQTPEALKSAIEKHEKRKFKPEMSIKSAKEFSDRTFEQRIMNIINKI